MPKAAARFHIESHSVGEIVNHFIKKILEEEQASAKMTVEVPA
jgi:hypothetical protein